MQQNGMECNRLELGEDLREKHGAKMCAKRVELCTFNSAEVTALHSGLVSHHCRQRPVSLALLPAWADPRVFNCQDVTVYTGIHADYLPGRGRTIEPSASAVEQQKLHVDMVRVRLVVKDRLRSRSQALKPFPTHCTGQRLASLMHVQ